MPRHPAPRWDRRRRRWVMNCGEPGKDGRAKEVYAPEAIGPRDLAGAVRWFEEYRRAREPEVVGPEVSVGRLCELYLEWAERRRDEGKLSRVHYANKQYHLGLLDEQLGERVAEALTPEAMNAFVDRVRAAYSAHYVANICATASAAFNWAVRAGLLARNPIVGYEAPPVPRAPERFAERAETAAFLRHWRNRADRRTVAGRYSRLTLLLTRCVIRTGARPGELCRLWWSDLRWDAGRTSAGLPFAKAVIPPERHKTGAKTGRPRTIYLTPALTRALRREFGRADRHPQHVFVHGRGRGGKGAGQPWESGSRLSKVILRVRREAIEAGVLPPEADEGHNRIVNYRWRHTAASTLLMMGVDVATVAELLGTGVEIVQRHYGHLLDRHLSAAAEKMHRPGARHQITNPPARQ